MPFFQKLLSASFVRFTACHASGQLVSARRALGPVMAALGWPLACGLAAIALWLRVQWWGIDHAALGDANATIEADWKAAPCL